MINLDIWNGKYAAYSGETYEQGCKRVTDALGVPELEQLLLDEKFSVGGRVWYGAGKPKSYMVNCGLFGVGDSAESWAKLSHDVELSLTKGLGCGIDYSAIRPYGSRIAGSGGTASGAVSKMYITNEIARFIMQGNTRRAALLAQLHWLHGDIHSFVDAKTWDEEQTRLKNINPDKYPAPLDLCNISVRLDDKFFAAYQNGDNQATKVWNNATNNMFRYSEPGFRYNPDNQVYTNACGEVISSYDRDTCTLGSINLAVVNSIDELEYIIKYAVLALLKVRHLTKYPTEEMRQVAINHPRVGLGVMGLHNWLIQRKLPYQWCTELDELFSAVYEIAQYYGEYWCKKYHYNKLEGHIAHAPTGSIARLFGGISSGIEPIFALAYKWRYTLNNEVREQVVIDSNVETFMEQGIDLDTVEDAYYLANPDGFKRRVEMQANIQRYCDNAISSTINLPAWGTPGNNELTLPIYRSILLEHLQELRGITVYANGSRSGQPLTAIPINEALEQVHIQGSEYSNCSNGACAL
jgi:ribonucleoside-diphosphate reductase alpha chain